MLNNITIMGRLTADPEVKTTQNQVPVTSFSVAVERNIKTKDGQRETDFVPVVAWRHTADFIAKYFKKGQMICITGELQSRKFEDKNGAKRTAWEVIANQAHFCGGSEKAESVEAENSGGGSGSMFEDVTDYNSGDLPF